MEITSHDSVDFPNLLLGVESIMAAKKVFISYSHKDAAHLETLKIHLKPLERLGLIEPWFDGYMVPGDVIDDEVGRALLEADIILLLVSPDFLASEYCYTIEMERALSRHEKGQARVVPIILRECLWKQTAPFRGINALPTDGHAILSLYWPDKDEAWRIVAEGVQAAAGAPPPKARPAPSPVKNSNPIAETDIPLPDVSPMKTPPKRSVTDKERDDFKHEAFDHIARRFEASIEALEDDLVGSFRRIDANRFTATIYQRGKKVGGFTVWIGGEHFSRDTINYVANDSGETRTINGGMSVELSDGSLYLKPSLGMFGMAEDERMGMDKAAEHLWSQFVDRLS